jgi:hypothetical protein
MEFRDDQFSRYTAECERLASIAKRTVVLRHATAARSSQFSNRIYQLVGLLAASAVVNAAGSSLLR